VRVSRFASCAVLCTFALAWAAFAQGGAAPIDLDHPAIAYRTTVSNDAVTALSRRLEQGSTTLRFDGPSGYLRSLLAALDVPLESQIVVFSNTSLQSSLISASTPRAIFFNDEVTVAWVRGGFIEVTAQDPRQGTSFYLLPQTETTRPQLVRDNRCISCHHSVGAAGVPGLLVRSIAATGEGFPLPWLANYTTDHRSPIEERWGGWYVTGTAGGRQHLGNMQLDDRFAKELPAWTAERAIASTGPRVERDASISPHSDIAALLVFNHQAHMMNLLTRVGWLARMAQQEGRSLQTLGDTVNELVDYMLFVDEAPIDPVRGTSGFAEQFAKNGRRDKQGRSLRDLDLRTRLLRYPCSYMIDSATFDALPDGVRNMIYGRLKNVLSGADRNQRYARLTATDRQAILEILRDTKSNLPAGF